MEIPAYVTASVLVASAFPCIAIPMVLARGLRATGVASWNTGIVGVALALWLTTLAILALNGVFLPYPGQVLPGPGVGLLLTLLGLTVAFLTSHRLQETLGLKSVQGALMGLQVWRIAGFAFLALMAHGQLPGLFALPAGIGDLAIGLSAPYMARNSHRRRLAVTWNLLGLLDLVMAVFLGVTTSPGRARLFATTPTSEVMAAFPLALIPVFLVPLSVGLHLISLRSLRSEPAPVPVTLSPQPGWRQT